MSIDHNETRRLVEALAESLGATRSAVFKWRQRGVPGEWKIRLVEASKKMLTFSDIESSYPFRGDASPSGAARTKAQQKKAAPKEVSAA
jgi:hypothetical protein